MAECLFTNKVVVGSNPVTVTYTPDMAMLRARRSLTFRQTIECIHSKTRTWHGNNIRYVLTFRNNIRFSWKYADINKSIWGGTWIQYIFLKTTYFFLLSTLFQHYPRNSFRLVRSEVYLETYQTSMIELFKKKLSQNSVN